MKKSIIILFILSFWVTACGNQAVVQESSNKNIQQITESEEMDENIPTDDIEYIIPAQSFEAGNGTAEDPYQIANAEQLALLSELCSYEKYDELDFEEAEHYIKGHYVLVADIGLNDISDFETWDTKAPKWQWKPIGETKDFMGTFDGNGHTIRGLYICNTKDISKAEAFEEGYNPGIFGKVFGAIIKNVNLADSYIVVKGNVDYVGGIVSSAYGTDILNCQSSVKIDTGNDSVCVGGVIGNLQYGNIKECFFSGELSYGPNNMVGGIAGNVSYFDVISGCNNKGYFSFNEEGDSFSYVGGIVGRADSQEESRIENCINESSIKSKDAKLGGIAGIVALSEVRHIELGETTVSLPAHVTISGCMNKGELISVCKDYAVGGIVSEIHNSSSLINDKISDMGVEIINCTNEGNMESAYMAAGIIGNCISASMWEIRECKNYGSIKAEKYAGGIVGQVSPSNLNSKIEKCLNEGAVYSEHYAGGILSSTLGFSLNVSEKNAGDIVVSECINTGNVSGGYAIAGIIGSCDSAVSAMYIQKCVNEGKIQGEDPYRIGGILGNSGFGDMLEYSKAVFVIQDCVNRGILIHKDGKIPFDLENVEKETLSQEELENYEEGTSAVRVIAGPAIGGIAAYCKQGIIENCFDYGKIFLGSNAIVAFTHENLMAEQESEVVFCGGICGNYFYMESTGSTLENTGIRDCVYSNNMPIGVYVSIENEGIENLQALSLDKVEKMAQGVLK